MAANIPRNETNCLNSLIDFFGFQEDVQDEKLIESVIDAFVKETGNFLISMSNFLHIFFNYFPDLSEFCSKSILNFAPIPWYFLNY